jgi:hypothetical protein
MYLALCERWRQVPPPAMALRRISAVLDALAGIKPEPVAPSAYGADARTASPSAAPAPMTPEQMHANVQQAMQAGFAAIQGRPNDPLLDFFDKSNAEKAQQNTAQAAI